MKTAPLPARRTASWLVRVLLVCTFLVPGLRLSAADEARRTYDLAAGDAAVTLKSFADQSGREIVYPADLVRGTQTNAVKGKLTAKEALDRMLSGTPLVASISRLGTLSVTRVDDPNAAGAVAKRSDRPTTQAEKNEEGVLKLDIFEVMGSKLLNMDKPRSRDDAQPYIVLDRAQIEQSGALDLQDFLKQRLTMNTQAATNSTSSAFAGALSSINLRGLGTSQTLVLIDGHRSASFGQAGNQLQSDLSGIPLAAVERIEVLPTTASGIYGGSATGGVVNIILRRDYAGVEVKGSYENTFDTDSAIKRVDLSAGLTLEGGKTNLLLTASYSEGNQLVTRDRRFVQEGRAAILANNPASLLSATASVLGATANIRSSNGANLVLRDGTPLNSPITYLPAGYAGYQASGGAPLVANAGKFNLDLSSDAGGGGGGLGVINGPVTEAISFTVRRQFSPGLQAFVELGAADVTSYYAISAAGQFTIAPSVAANPFNQTIIVRTPLPGLPSEQRSENNNRRAVGGIIFRLPWKWTGEMDYTWNRVKFGFQGNGALLATAASAVSNGTINILRDINAYPVDMLPYVATLGTPNGPFVSTLKDTTLRLAGPVLTLPGGDVQATVSAEHLEDELAEGAQTITGTVVNVYPPRARRVDSAYAEFRVPLVSAANQSRPFLHDLELQLAVRQDNYTVEGVTNSLPAGSTTPVSRATNKTDSTNPTIGLKYKPVEGLTLRASYGTGFLPPSTNNVLPASQTFASTVSDPRRGGAFTSIAGAQVLIGGNPDLGPEKSENWSVGLVLTPRQVKGLRLSVDYTHMRKTDNITTLTAQQIVDNESIFADRVTRAAPAPGDPFPVGPITALNITALNIAQAVLESYDVALDYSTGPTGFGSFDLFAMSTWQTHFQTQLLPGLPIVENAGIGGGFLSIPLKFKAVGGLTWKRGRFTAGWTTRYLDSYLASTNATVRLSQGNGGRVASQVYHDVFASYRVGQKQDRLELFGGTEFTVGVKNLFNASPPFDAGNPTLLVSTLGDGRLAVYYVSVKRAF